MSRSDVLVAGAASVAVASMTIGYSLGWEFSKPLEIVLFAIGLAALACSLHFGALRALCALSIRSEPLEFGLGYALPLAALFWVPQQIDLGLSGCEPDIRRIPDVERAIDPQLDEPSAIRRMILDPSSHKPYSMTILGKEPGLRNIHPICNGKKCDGLSKGTIGGISVKIYNPSGLLELYITPAIKSETHLHIDFECIR